MDELEEDFLAGLLDIPDTWGDLQELTEITPLPQLTSRKRQALSTIDTNVEPKQKKKKKTAKPDVPTGTILDVAEFDLASQRTTKEDEMLKDIKRILHAVLRMEKGIERLSKELKDHIQDCGRQADDTPASGHMPPRHYLRCNQDAHSCQFSLRTLSPLKYFKDQRCCHHLLWILLELPLKAHHWMCRCRHQLEE